MKKEDVTYQDKLNELRLDLLHPNNYGIVFVLLEGDSDVRLFRKLFNLDKCKVEIVPGGKFKLEECVNSLVNVYTLLFGIRDADFVHLNGIEFDNQNIFLTDMHDIEMSMISVDEVFCSLIFEYTDLIKSKHHEVRSDVMKTIIKISLLKWLNDKENLKFNFESGFQDLISFVNLDIDFEQYFSRIISKSPEAVIKDLKIISQKIEDLEKTNPDSFQLCNGHDFISAISIYLKKYGDTRTINEKLIYSTLRSSYSFSHYEKTALFSKTNLWCKNMNCEIY